MSNSKPPFRPIAVLLTTLAILLTTAGFAFHSLMGGGTSSFEYLLPTLFVIALIGMKLAAPRIPWPQLALLVVAVFGIHLLAEHLLPLMLIAEKLIEIVCVLGFGAYWVAKGYIPRESNRW
jgi:hypothetical protein